MSRVKVSIYNMQKHINDNVVVKVSEHRRLCWCLASISYEIVSINIVHNDKKEVVKHQQLYWQGAFVL